MPTTKAPAAITAPVAVDRSTASRRRPGSRASHTTSTATTANATA